MEVVTPQVREVEVPLSPQPTAAEPEGRDEEGQAAEPEPPFERLHQPREVEERRSLRGGCIWFRCADCARLRRLTNWTSRRKPLPERCSAHPDARKRSCAAPDDWLAARLGLAFAESVHARLGAAELDHDAPSAAALAQLGVAIDRPPRGVATPLPERLLRAHLFIAAPAGSRQRAPPPLYRLGEGVAVWAKTKRAGWWPCRVGRPQSSTDAIEQYLVTLAGHDCSDGAPETATVRTTQLRPLSAADPEADSDSWRAARGEYSHEARAAAVQALLAEHNSKRLSPRSSDTELDRSVSPDGSHTVVSAQPTKAVALVKIPRKPAPAAEGAGADGAPADELTASSAATASEIAPTGPLSFAEQARIAAQETLLQIRKREAATGERDSAKRQRAPFICHQCGGEGHKARDCPWRHDSSAKVQSWLAEAGDGRCHDAQDGNAAGRVPSSTSHDRTRVPDTTSAAPFARQGDRICFDFDGKRFRLRGVVERVYEREQTMKVRVTLDDMGTEGTQVLGWPRPTQSRPREWQFASAAAAAKPPLGAPTRRPVTEVETEAPARARPAQPPPLSMPTAAREQSASGSHRLSTGTADETHKRERPGGDEAAAARQKLRKYEKKLRSPGTISAEKRAEYEEKIQMHRKKLAKIRREEEEEVRQKLRKYEKKLRSPGDISADKRAEYESKIQLHRDRLRRREGV